MAALAGALAGLALLAALLPLPSAAQTAGEASWDDPPGDASVLRFGGGFPLPAPGTPSNPLVDAVDLRTLTIGAENETHVTVTLAVQDVDFALNSQTHLFGSIYYSILFRVNGGDDLYEIVLEYSPSGSRFIVCCPAELTGDPEVYAALWLYEDAEGRDRGFDGDDVAGLAASVDEAANTFTVLLPRQALATAGADGLPSAPAAGDRLSDLSVESNGNFPSLHSDLLPDDGTVGDFTFALSTADLLVSVEPWTAVMVDDGGDDGLDYYGERVAAPEAGERGVAPGRAQAFPLAVTNHDSVKRVVNLTATVEGGASPGWSAKIVPNLPLASNESAVVNVIVTAAPDAGHRERAVVKVRAVALGRPDHLGYEELRLFAVQTPGPAAKVLFLHTDLQPPADAVEEALGDFRNGPYGALNVLRDDAAYTDRALELGIFPWTGRSYWMSFEMDTPLGEDLLFDLAGTVRVDLALAAEVETSFGVIADLYAGGTPVGSSEASTTLGTSATTVSLEFSPSRHAERIPASAGRVTLEIWLTPDHGPASDYVFLSPSQPSIDPRGSSLTLPLLDPGTQLLTVTTGEFLPSLTFAQGKGAEAYVNPGETTVFNLTVANEGTRDDVIRLDINASDAGWTVELRPSSTFRLASGERANLSLWVRAPAEAAEGALFSVDVQATSAGEPAATTKVRASAVVTRAIEIEDEAPFFDVKGKERKGSPAPGAAAFAALVLLALRRRRSPE